MIDIIFCLTENTLIQLYLPYYQVMRMLRCFLARIMYFTISNPQVIIPKIKYTINNTSANIKKIKIKLGILIFTSILIISL